MNIHEYINHKKEIQKEILSLFEQDQNGESVDLRPLIKLIKKQKILEDEDEFRLLMHLIDKISQNYHRSPNFFNIIENILLLFKDEFRKYLKNQDIFYCFYYNNRITLMLLEHKIIEFDENIAIYIQNRISNNTAKYFINEIKPFLHNNNISIIDEMHSIDQTMFEHNRKKGENEQTICEFIRNDTIDDFIRHINEKNIPLDMKITPSIFETNFYLLDKSPTLIEYACFFGSIQIFNYLKLKGIELTPSLWLYAIHGKNAEIIHLLEENHIQPEDESYQKIFEESVSCHHNEIADYIQENYLIANNENNLYASISSYNYEYFPEEYLLSKNAFSCFCEFDYFFLAKSMLDTVIFNAEFYYFNSKENAIYTPFAASISSNILKTVKLLINRPEIDINSTIMFIQNNDEQIDISALRYAIAENNIDIFDFLLKQKKINVNSKIIAKTYENKDKGIFRIAERCPLFYIASNHNLTMLNLLLKHKQIDVNTKC